MSLSAAAAVTRTKDGERAPQEEATLTSVQEAAEGGKDERELASSSAPLKACPAEELPRRSFHIPRKNKEKQGKFSSQEWREPHEEGFCYAFFCPCPKTELHPLMSYIPAIKPNPRPIGRLLHLDGEEEKI